MFNNEIENYTVLCSNILMGRPPKIVRESVLDSAMHCFWERGYSQTSIDDLVMATGLQRGSLYFYFSDKKALFLAVLEHYKKEVVVKRRHLVDSASNAREGIEIFFAETLKTIDGANFYWGCLNTNTASQLHQITEPEILEWIKAGVAGWEKYWTQVVERGIEDGSICVQTSPRNIAIALVALTQGSNVILRSLNNPTASRRAIKTILNGILGEGRNKSTRSRTNKK